MYQAIVDETAQETGASGTSRNRLKLVGAAGQTPMVWVGDVVRLEFRRSGAGQGAPEPTDSEPSQGLNALVAEVSNAMPVDFSTVIMALEGYTSGLNLFPGDSLTAELVRLAPGPGAPGV